MRVDGVLGRLAAVKCRELAHGPPVCDDAGDVWPLPRVGAFGEHAAELVQRRPHAQDAVGVVVDERDLVQYFEK
jgi:hypothetical protein